MKSLFRYMFPLLGVVTVSAVVGCSSAETATTDPANASTKSTLATDTNDNAKRPHGFRAHGPHRGGPDFLVFAALHEDIGLSAEQKTTIEGLVKNGRGSMMKTHAPDKAKTAVLAQAIRSGNVDATALRPNKDEMEAKMKEHQARSAQNLATLHKTLTPAQRAALVDAVVAKHAKHGQRGPGGPEGRAHGPRPEMKMKMKEGGPMAHLLQGINLTEEQKATLKAKLDANRPAAPSESDRAAMKVNFETMKKDMDAKLQSFKSDSFDANAFVAPPANAPKPPAGMADHMAKELQIIVSVLDASQREELAKRIEQGPPARH